ncbi:siphovirus ReqiPepy6 Gp37-like family protein [Streptomyces sp. 891-h]|uniref:siphovirus ReqiPepy6 Gp37-like family protein n=1 Tax=Streptomyces sp. 891-h TaxID=2720714 RepID=UPI001FAA3C35|nr:siphovirus ReqiPepy6 Gp37-like family protein [Streptomyces sp. 891-h]UNZ20632.1 hypothetical protein HC362_29770 [Streptomyces sp. 891-h]
MAIDLLITDGNLTVVGDPIGHWTSLDCTRRFNEPGSGTVELPAYPEVMAQLQPGYRLMVIRDGQVWMSGPMEIPQDYSWSIGESPEPGVGKVTVEFTDDLALPAGYITWADPTATWANQPDTAAYSITNTNAETIIRTLVDVNCGPSALAARRLANFALDTAAGVGTTTSVNTRFEGLLETCRRVAVDGGGLGFRTRATSTQILFEVYAPQDLTATARFSTGLGNLRSVQYKQSAPTITHALVQGSEVEAPADRIFVEVSHATAASDWWRVEQLIDGSAETDTDGELTQDGNAELAEGAAPIELATVTVDTEDLRAGADFDLGDKVTVELPTGLEVADVVRSIHLQATPTSGEYVTTLIGSPEATSDPRMVQLVRKLGRRLGRLEAR